MESLGSHEAGLHVVLAHRSFSDMNELVQSAPGLVRQLTVAPGKPHVFLFSEHPFWAHAALISPLNKKHAGQLSRWLAVNAPHVTFAFSVYERATPRRSLRLKPKPWSVRNTEYVVSAAGVQRYSKLHWAHMDRQTNVTGLPRGVKPEEPKAAWERRAARQHGLAARQQKEPYVHVSPAGGPALEFRVCADVREPTTPKDLVTLVSASGLQLSNPAALSAMRSLVIVNDQAKRGRTAVKDHVIAVNGKQLRVSFLTEPSLLSRRIPGEPPRATREEIERVLGQKDIALHWE